MMIFIHGMNVFLELLPRNANVDVLHKLVWNGIQQGRDKRPKGEIEEGEEGE
jgi:hypothetical protein